VQPSQRRHVQVPGHDRRLDLTDVFVFQAPASPEHHLDRTQPATYPNGRVTTDEVYSLRFACPTCGKVSPSGLKPTASPA